MGNVWNREVAELGYRAPLPDRGTTPAGTARTRVPTPASTSTSATSARTATTATPPPTGPTRRPPRPTSSSTTTSRTSTGSATPGQLLRVTAAHEFFHVVQFGYDQYEDGWFMEATATWMEERVYDSVNDNRQFLPASALALPGRSLDYPLTTATAYGNWIFFEFLSSRSAVAWSGRCGRGPPTTASTPRWRSAGPSRPRAPACVPGSRASPPPTSTPRAPTPRAGTTAARRSPRRTRCPPASRAPAARTTRLDHLAAHSYAFTAGSSLTGSRTGADLRQRTRPASPVRSPS